MVNLEKLATEYRSEGYIAMLADARVCQDIVLKAISESSLNRNVTIKGGVVMRSITGNVRRATRDIDFDFIKYPIDKEFRQVVENSKRDNWLQIPASEAFTRIQDFLNALSKNK